MPATTETPITEISEQFIKAAKDALYISVGLGVLAYQKSQVQRHDLTKAVEASLTRGREQASKLIGSMSETFAGPLAQLDTQAAAFEARVDDVLDGIQTRLPKPAADVLSQVRTTAKSAQAQVRDFVRGAA